MKSDDYTYIEGNDYSEGYANGYARAKKDFEGTLIKLREYEVRLKGETKDDTTM